MSNFIFALVYLTQLIVFLESSFLYKSQLEITQKFSLVDDIFFANLGIIIPYPKEKREMFFRILLLIAIEVIIKFAVHAVGFYWHIEYRFSFYNIHPSLVTCLRSIEIMCFMCLLQSRLKLIINELIDIQISIKYRSQMQKVETIEMWDNAFEKPSTFNRLIRLKILYSELFEICRKIGKTFGFSLLIIVFHTFALFTFEYYWAYIHLTDLARMTICAIYAVPNVVILSALAFYCSSCSTQVYHNDYPVRFLISDFYFFNKFIF